MTSAYYAESVRLGRDFQESNKSWAGYDVVKYQNCIKDLVDRYGARTILDYGCGKGQQYTEPLPYAGEHNWQTFDAYLGVSVYCYDPCVAGLETPPPAGTKFDGVICTQVLNSIPDHDLSWVSKQLFSHTDKFCFVSLNFQQVAKKKKFFYDPKLFKEPRTRDFFKQHFADWPKGKVFWWWKDRSHYPEWVDDQLNTVWNDVPDSWTDKYQYVEAIYR